ncbi:MAG: hypothetical protein ACXVKO_16365 [Bacteriovorax sp.]
MKNASKILSQAMTMTIAITGVAMATPSTQIWIPSTDIQTYKTFHLGIDNYFRASSVSKSPPTTSATRDANVMDIGPTVGILPYEKVKAEVGIDYLVNANNPNDNHPLSGNFKVGTPEDSIFKSSPAIAVGMYNVGPSLSKSDAPLVTSGQNIAYALLARTLPVIGRLSAGYYHGSEKALINTSGNSANDGVLLSWDRSMTEISDKLWFAVDYQGGNNVDGAINVGGSWNFAPNVSVIFGYDIYTKQSLAGNNTFTTQLDINFP